MPCEWLEHTADIRVRIYGKTLEELFADALKAMTEILAPTDREPKQADQRPISIQASDVTSLVIDFLNAVLLETTLRKTAYRQVTFHALAETGLRALLSGFRFESLGRDIKAVTYHEANVHKNQNGDWETQIVFDL
jgi:SHS2 domain-containing protein